MAWINQNSGLMMFIVIPLLAISIVLALIIISRYRAVFRFWQWVLFVFFLTLIGGVVGLITNYVSKLDAEFISLLVGLFFGFLIGVTVLIGKPGLWGFKCSQIQVTVPQLSQMTFIVDDKNRQVAWILFVETITRISTQPLENEGLISEAMSSLYTLFGVIRGILKSAEPSRKSSSDSKTVELFAVLMLNNVLRPFLAKWHPLFEHFRKSYPQKDESEWEWNTDCRKELEILREQVIEYAHGFGKLAEVKELDSFFPKKP